MKPQEEPIHIKCEKGDIAPLVIMSGDPLRAKYIAEKFLKDAKLVTSVRNMYGYTGTYKGKSITVMGHGMGMPSVSIYSWELFHYYKVEKIIRVGTAGVVNKNVKLLDVVLAQQVYSESNFGLQYNGFAGFVVDPSRELNQNILEVVKQKNKSIHYGTILTTDVFGPYINIDAILNRVPEGVDPLVEEMEAYGLVHVANSFHKEATCLVTAVDSKFEDKVISIEDRERSLDEMITLALEAIIV